MRDSMIIYRSFYEAIKELTKEEQANIYDAIFSYGLDFNEVQLTGISKTVFTLIKPQIDANIKRYNNGLQPKQKQEISKTKSKRKQKKSKTEANENVNVNANENEECKLELESKSEETLPPLPLHYLQTFVKEKLPNVAKLKTQLTIENCDKLCGQHTSADIKDILLAMENKKDLTKRYESVYLTIIGWLRLRDKNKPETKPTQSRIKMNAEPTLPYEQKYEG